MTRPDTSIQALSIGLTAIDAFAADPDAAAPEWIKVAPRGAFSARDGRQFNVSPEALVERFNADGIAVPIDIDHATVKKAASGDEAGAVGWIEELQARADGLYGRVKWLADGLRVLAAKSHRYISPAFPAGKDGRAMWLHSAALVAAPALSMPAVASAISTEQGASDMDAKPIALALDLAEAAGQTDILAAILSLKQKATMQTASASTSLATLAVGLSKDRVALIRTQREQKAEEAIRRGIIPPSLRQWSIDLMAVDEQQFDTFCANVGMPLAYLSKSGISDEQIATLGAGGASEQITGAATNIARQLGIDPKKLLD